LHAFDIFQSQLITRFAAAVHGWFSPADDIRAIERRWRRQLTTLDERLQVAFRGERPWFTFSYLFNPAHSSNRQNWRQLEYYLQLYREELIPRMNRHIQRIVNRIIAQDPSAIIIVMGDHGGVRYRGIWEHDKAKDINDAFARNNIAPQTVARDVFGILMAVRAPAACKRRLYDTITPVNLFRVLFSCMNDKIDLMTDRPADIAYFRKGLKAVVDGVPLPAWRY